MTTRAKHKAAGRGSIGDNPVFRTLNAYKEVILLVLFFLGGAGWIYGTFATKCLLQASLESNAGLMDWQGKVNALNAKRLEIETLENLQDVVALTPTQVEHLKQLRDQYRDLAQKSPSAPESAKAAFEKCTVS
jgi:hypothetical protein